jgi:CheY-like chemotaxis protein
LNLLVAEDDVLTRYAIADALRSQDYRVLEASSGDDALTVLQSVPVHLLFVDVHMPGRSNGLDVARFAKSLAPAPKIILTSGQVAAADIQDLPVLGTFVPKPYLISRVIDLVNAAFRAAGSR